MTTDHDRPPRQGPFTPDRPARLAVLISGGGRTMLNLHDRMSKADLPATIRLVIASRDCAGADRAKARGLPTLLIPNAIPEKTLDRVLTDHGIDWVVLAGYLSLVSIPERYRTRVVNIHPALLPAFGGPGMYGSRVHQAVLTQAARDPTLTESGCTVHLCDAEYDTGPIILQRRCPIEPGDSPNSLAARVFEQELIAMPEAIRLLLARE